MKFDENEIRKAISIMKPENSLFEIRVIVILSILVDTFISKISLTMQPGPKIDSISGA